MQAIKTKPALTKTQRKSAPKVKKWRTSARVRLADRNRRWRIAVENCMNKMSYSASDLWDTDRLAAVFDAIASEASCGEVASILQR